MKNIIGYLVLGLLIIIGISEVIILGKAICGHVNEPAPEAVEKVDYSDAAIVVGEYLILQHNGWTTH